MESFIRDIIMKERWTLERIFRDQDWPGKQQGSSHPAYNSRSQITNHCDREWDSVQGLLEANRFFSLWTGTSPFFVLLKPEPSWHKEAGALRRYRGPGLAVELANSGLKAVTKARKESNHDTSILKQVWSAKSWRGIPVSALLEDAVGADGRKYYFLYCRTTMARKLRYVARRIAIAPKFAFSQHEEAEERKKEEEKMKEKFAALVLAMNLGWGNLSKWQRVELAVIASEVDRVLTRHGVTEEVDQAPPIDPDHRTVIDIPCPMQLDRCLGHQHIPSLTARQAQRSAVSQEALRERWA